MKAVTAAEMSSIDRTTISKYGIPSAVLMERAGLAVAERICGMFKKKKVIVLAGGGNNGGDGLVVARILHSRGWNLKVLLLAEKAKLSPDCLAQYHSARTSGVPVEFSSRLTKRDVHGAVAVDAIFGTGLSKPVSGKTASTISFLNNADIQVVSVDIPSGISADSGQVMGEAVRADYTVTFGLPKRGHFLYPGADYSGTLFVEDIGFPQELLTADNLRVAAIEQTDASLLLPERPTYSHKGDYGHVLVVAGSRGKTGAALLCAKACMRTGSGMVTLGVPETIADVFQKRITEEMVLPLPDKGDGTLSEKAVEPILEFLGRRGDVLAAGPGLSLTEDIAVLFRKLLAAVTAPMVLDADALNAVAGDVGILKKTKAPVILTPHTGEMARLLKGVRGKGHRAKEKSLQAETEKDRITTAMAFARRTETYLVLKGVPTIIAEPEGRSYINTTGNPGMATAGSGDVLTGMIASLVGQGLSPVEASVLGTYLHGLAGDTAAKEKGMHSVIASDIIRKIPSSFQSVRSRMKA